MDQLCPLPIDWLEYLEGQSEFAAGLEKHLADCPSCQVLLATLEAAPVTTLNSDWAASFRGRLDRVWHEERPLTPARAEFWFSSSRYELPKEAPLAKGGGFALPSFSYENLNRTLLLVVGDPQPERGFDWVDVVPVLSDVERATETDYIFCSTESSLGSPWRAMFAHQTKVARGQLDTRVGMLQGSGIQALHDVLNDSDDESRWGLALEDMYDPRAFESEYFEETLRALRTPWLVVSEAAGSSAATTSNVFILRQPEHRVTKPDPGHGGDVYWGHQLVEPPEGLAAYAASTVAPKPGLWELDATAFRLLGKLKLHKPTGFLAFLVWEVELRQPHQLRLVVRTHEAREYVSDAFTPVADSEVPIAEGLTPSAVDKLGAEVIA